MKGALLMKHKFPLTLAKLNKITATYPTPFYLYEEKAIRENIKKLQDAFSWNQGFREYFAIKTAPNPFLLDIFKAENCGIDCSSETELILADSCGFTGKDIMFTSNVTTANEFRLARQLDAIINLDDASHIPYLKQQAGLPDLICMRLNPQTQITYQNKTIINHLDSKFGFTPDQLIDSIILLKKQGVKRFGIHCQFGCHQREADYFGENARNVFEQIIMISKKADVTFEFINLAGGIGISYQEEEENTNIQAISDTMRSAYESTILQSFSTPIPLFLELGIFMTGPYGYFVTRFLHIKKTAKTFLGLDASTNSFMTPSKYSNYHAITVAGKENEPCNHTYDITGSLCENRDRFAIAKKLPEIEIGDFIIFHDAGAYCFSHANHFNGKLSPGELLICEDGSIRQIRRPQSACDYFSTLDYPIIYR